MKKFLAMILALVMVLAMVSVASAEDAMRVAMITDYGDITDQSFNQTTYEACKKWAEENGVDFTYFKPAGDSTAERVAMVDAVEWGEEFPPDGYSRMSALIRRVSGDETLWEIAREYHTAVEAIALANQMNTDSVPARGELLLIPMKK